MSTPRCEFELKRDLDLAEIRYECPLSHAKGSSSILRFYAYED
jgi:hypothetical protein